MISDSNLLQLNQEGIIPGPDESEEALQERSIYCYGLQPLCSGGDAIFPGCETPETSALRLKESHSITSKLFDIKPSWLPLVFSNYRLHPWHGGCAWIFQIKEDSPSGAILQLRKSFRAQETYLGIYHRKELISHELAHVGRMMFNEPRYEELLAYQTSHSPFRRWFGPLVQSSGESLAFMIIFSGILILDVALLYLGAFELYLELFILKALPGVLLLMAIGRLWIRQRTLKHCQANLRAICNDEQIAKAITYRLTDKEIEFFSKATQSEILSYASKNQNQSLRWRLLCLAYPILNIKPIITTENTEATETI